MDKEAILSTTKENGIYTFAQKVIDNNENKLLIERSIQKHGYKDWLKLWLIKNINSNLNEEIFNVTLDYEKYGINSAIDAMVAYTIALEDLLKQKYGVE